MVQQPSFTTWLYVVVGIVFVYGETTAKLDSVGCDFSVCDPAIRFFTDLSSFLTEDGLREDQAEALCREASTLKTCLAFVEKCIPQTIPHVHEFFRGNVQMLEVCTRNTPAQILTKVQTMNGCDRKLNATAQAFDNCDAGLSLEVSNLLMVLAGGMFTDGIKLPELCCAFQSYDDCVGKDEPLKICGAADAQPSKEMLDAIYSAYSCEAKFATCSSASAPSHAAALHHH